MNTIDNCDILAIDSWVAAGQLVPYLGSGGQLPSVQQLCSLRGLPQLFLFLQQGFQFCVSYDPRIWLFAFVCAARLVISLRSSQVLEPKKSHRFV